MTASSPAPRDDTGVREELAVALCRLWGYEPDDPDVAVAAAEVLDVVMPTVQRLIDQGKAEAIRPFEELFAGDPDTPCRTTWRKEPGWSLPGASAEQIECVEVPMDDLRDAFDRAALDLTEGRR